MSGKCRKYAQLVFTRWLAFLAISAVICGGCENAVTEVGSTESIASVSVQKTDWMSVQRAMQISEKPKLANPQVPPVTELIDRLAARTQADPTNTGNWILLAQSHEFLGNTVASEQAIVEALRYGADEALVRQQVSQAKTGRR